jgi:hypothetical protein
VLVEFAFGDEVICAWLLIVNWITLTVHGQTIVRIARDSRTIRTAPLVGRAGVHCLFAAE